MVQFRSDWPINIDTLQREMERLLEQFASRKPPLVRYAPRTWEPAIDVYETAGDIVVVAELAGLSLEDIRISVHTRTLIIRGERKESQHGSKRTYYQIEIPQGPFERGILLPVDVDTANARASYSDGMLEIVLPKRLEQQSRKVSIHTT